MKIAYILIALLPLSLNSMERPERGAGKFEIPSASLLKIAKPSMHGATNTQKILTEFKSVLDKNLNFAQRVTKVSNFIPLIENANHQFEEKTNALQSMQQQTAPALYQEAHKVLSQYMHAFNEILINIQLNFVNTLILKLNNRLNALAEQKNLLIATGNAEQYKEHLTNYQNVIQNASHELFQVINELLKIQLHETGGTITVRKALENHTFNINPTIKHLHASTIETLKILRKIFKTITAQLIHQQFTPLIRPSVDMIKFLNKFMDYFINTLLHYRIILPERAEYKTIDDILTAIKQQTEKIDKSIAQSEHYLIGTSIEAFRDAQHFKEAYQELEERKTEFDPAFYRALEESILKKQIDFLQKTFEYLNVRATDEDDRLLVEDIQKLQRTLFHEQHGLSFIKQQIQKYTNLQPLLQNTLTIVAQSFANIINKAINKESKELNKKMSYTPGSILLRYYEDIRNSFGIIKDVKAFLEKHLPFNAQQKDQIDKAFNLAKRATDQVFSSLEKKSQESKHRQK